MMFLIKQLISQLSQRAKLKIYHSVFIPSLTYGHDRCVMTE